MGEFAKIFGYEAMFELCRSPVDRWLDIEDYLILIILVEGLCARKMRCLG